MNEFQKNTALLNAAEIVTEKIYLEGEEIGDAMLPKLVKRVSLEPTIEHDEVQQNNLYTLHNDAGECLYVSPFLEPSINENVTIRRKRIWWRGGVRRPRWWFLPIVLPAHPGGRRRRRRRLLTYNINYYYSALTNPSYVTLKQIPVNNNKIDWRSYSVTSTKYTFQGTGLIIVRTSFPKTTDATGMYSQCSKLKEFYGRRYVSCLTTDYMFKDCISLTTYGSGAAKAFPIVTSAKEMFRNCKSLKNIEIEMPLVTNVHGIFRGCTALKNIQGSDFSKVTNAESMFDGCSELTSIYNGWTGAEIQDADYAFYGCAKLTSPKVTGFPKLETAVSMYYGAGLTGSLDLTCNELLNGTSMFQKCTGLTSVTTLGKFEKLTNGKQMFAQCTGIQSADVNFNMLENGTNMFYGCSSLTTLHSVSFPKLQTGLGMFGGCRLDAASIQKILDALKLTGGMPETYNGQTNGMVIGCDSSLKNNNSWRLSVGLPSEYTTDDKELIKVDVVTPQNGNPSTITVRCTWN
jgi:hypothetical protein